MKRLILFLFLLISGFSSTQTTDTYTTSASWTIPSGVTSVTINCWGAGGGGGGAKNTGSATNCTGGGGGGGACSTTTYTVSAGQILTITVEIGRAHV